MKKFNLFIGALALLLMFGCIPKSTVDQSYRYTKGDTFAFEIIDQVNVSEERMDILKTRMKDNLNELGYSSSNPNKVLEITITDFTLLATAKRALFGAFAGSDSIKSTVKIKEKNNGKVVGQIKVETGTGSIYSSSTGIIQGHADQITNYLKTGVI